MNSLTNLNNEARSCGCIGPQNGEPLCPCMMIGLTQRDGRWIKPEEDLGPVHDIRLTGKYVQALINGDIDDLD